MLEYPQATYFHTEVEGSEFQERPKQGTSISFNRASNIEPRTAACVLQFIGAGLSHQLIGQMEGDRKSVV